MSLVKPDHAGYFCGQSVTALAERLRAGSLTSVELTQAALDTIARLNPTLNAFVQVDAPVALAQARKTVRAGISNEGNPSRINIIRTLRSAHEIGRASCRERV